MQRGFVNSFPGFWDLEERPRVIQDGRNYFGQNVWSVSRRHEYIDFGVLGSSENPHGLLFVYASQ